MNTKLIDPLLTLQQAADEASVSNDCMRTRVRRGDLPHIRIGNRIRIRRRDLEAFLAKTYSRGGHK